MQGRTCVFTLPPANAQTGETGALRSVLSCKIWKKVRGWFAADLCFDYIKQGLKSNLQE